MKSTVLIKRDQKIVEMFKDAKTMQEVGDKFKISRERVRQIIARNGLSSKDGGYVLRAKNKKIVRDANKFYNHFYSWLPTYGCSREQCMSINGNTRNITDKSNLSFSFLHFRNNCLKRKLEFTLSFPQWYDIWLQSGQIDNRGLRKGQYMMIRKDKLGGYTPENVDIACAQTSPEIMKKKEICKNGHRLEDPNLIYFTGENGRPARKCKACYYAFCKKRLSYRRNK